jgi:thiamine-phosphate pyrophosphorylase
MMSEYPFILHLRKPFASLAELETLVQQIHPAYYDRIVLHDHYALAEKYRLKGIHWNARNEDFKLEGAYWQKASISRSCHSIPEVEMYKNQYQYVTLSPIFDSISKQGYKAAFSESELKSAIGQGIINHQVIALGGIDTSNIHQLATMGFGGAAVLGVIWNHTELTSIRKELNLLMKFAN